MQQPHHQIDQDNTGAYATLMGSDDNHVSRFSLLCICSVAIYILTYGNSRWHLANHGLKSMKGYQQMSYEQIAHMTGTKGEATESETLESSFPLLKNKNN